MTVPLALLSHRSDEHLTPRFILDAVIECLGGIDLDPCSNSRCCPNVPAARHFIQEDDGLSQPWDGRVFLNPPFGRDVDRWFTKLAGEYCAGRTSAAIVLWKSATETKAWQVLTGVSCQVCFPSRRIDFEGPGNVSGSTFSPALFYLGRDRARFMLAFEGLGPIWEVPGGAGVPSRNYTRGRRVEYLARDHLRQRGFCVIRSAGSRTPVDLVAGKHRQILFVQTKRTRRPLSDTRSVLSRFQSEIARLQEVYRTVELPVELWVYTDQEGWRFFTVHPGGIAEVSEDDH